MAIVKSPEDNSSGGSIAINPIGVLRCGFPEKFGIPRQPGLVMAAVGQIVLRGVYADPEAVRGLADFSHIWLLFHFHLSPEGQWRPTVRPPRLGGNKRIGVFASRSPFRPNGIGQSVVALLDVATGARETRLTVAGIDLVDGTPIFDIKPYLPYADRIDDATGGFAGDVTLDRMAVSFSEAAMAGCREAVEQQPDFQMLVHQLLALDPRPAYDAVRQPDKEYAMGLYEWQVRWRVTPQGVEVTAVDRSPEGV